MLLSLKWLREFVPFEGTDQELGDKLTMVGLELEEIMRPFAHLDKVVVGHVVECDRHPEADKLSVTKVDVGQGEALPIVCGAPNVAKGQKVAVALVGAELPGGLVIKKAKLRGQPSTGMICAEDELGLGESHSGIMVLDEGLTVGTPLVEALNLDDVVFDIGVTPNRSDCFSILGLARETAMIFDLPLTMPAFELREEGDNAADRVRIDIQDPDDCPLYTARIIEGVDVKQAPAWMRYRLIAMGLRPINNLVDITNYVMLELGQPLHAFDADLLTGDVVRTARAKEGMVFTTLDNHERKLLASDILIWDAEKPVALAGVMGGANSEIHDGSRNVLLESAVFRPGAVRKTERRLALPSDASYRFERGVDQTGVERASDRAAFLMTEYAGGTTLRGMAKAEPKPWTSRRMIFRIGRAEKLLGYPQDADFCRRTLLGMGCELDEKSPDEWSVTAPGHRLDLEREVDLFEEVARVHGMDNIQPVLPKVTKALDDIGGGSNRFSFVILLKEWGVAAGLNEAVNYSFVGDADHDRLGLPKEERVYVANPLSEDQGVMRTRVAPGLLNSLKHNMSHGNVRLRLFEVSKTFIADATSETTAREPLRLGLLLHGGRSPERWPWKDEDVDFTDLRGLMDNLVAALRLPAAKYVAAGDHPYLAPYVEVHVGGKIIGEAGMVKPDIADEYYARKGVWLAEIDADLLHEMYAATRLGFQPLPVFPPVRRDVTFIAPGGLSVGELLQASAGVKEDLLESAVLVDLFTPEGGDERNLTVRFTYRHPEKTLKDKEVDKRHTKVVQALTSALPVKV